MQPAPHTTTPTGREILWEISDLAGGISVMLLPAMLLAFPGFVLFIAAPVALVLVVAAVPAAVVAAAIGLPYLLVRAIRSLAPA